MDAPGRRCPRSRESDARWPPGPGLSNRPSQSPVTLNKTRDDRASGSHTALLDLKDAGILEKSLARWRFSYRPRTCQAAHSMHLRSSVASDPGTGSPGTGDEMKERPGRSFVVPAAEVSRLAGAVLVAEGRGVCHLGLGAFVNALAGAVLVSPRRTRSPGRAPGARRSTQRSAAARPRRSRAG